jgi:hypothetical protein
MADIVKEKEDRLGDILIKKKMIAPEQLDQAVQCQVLFGGRLGTNLLELGFISEDQLRKILEEKYEIPAVSRKDLLEIPREAINFMSRGFSVEHKLVPVRLNDDVLEVAMLDPLSESSVSALAEATSLKIEKLIALELDLYWAQEKYYAVKREARYINLDRWLEQQRDMKQRPARKKPETMKREPLLPDLQDITALEGSPKDLEDFWDRVGRTGYPEHLLPRVLKDLEMAGNRDEISGVILDFAAMHFMRTLLFVINEDMLFGWDGQGEGLDSRVALAIMLPLKRRSIFKTVLETGAYFLGPIPDTTINNRFTAAFGATRPKSVLLLPILVSDKVVAILYGDMGHEKSVSAVPPALQRVLAAAGQAFQRLIVKQKQDNPKPPEKN